MMAGAAIVTGAYSAPMRIMLAAVAVLLVLTGCSSSHRAAKKSAAFSPKIGTDAAVIANHVPGCSGVRAESSDGLLPHTLSAASCTMDGHKVELYGWESAAAAAQPLSHLGGNTVAVAHGAGWSAIVDDAASGSEQRSILGRIVAAVGGKVTTS